MKINVALAAVSLRSALKYRRNWNKNGPTVQLLRKFMPRSSAGYRLYIPIGSDTTPHVVPPVSVRQAVRKAGFKITDYRAKKCVKIKDKDQKNEFNIGKVIAHDPVAKAAFDNDPQLQNSKTSEFTLVVSCHPYDIIGMSTGRDWDDTSCMRLKDFRDNHIEGINTHFLERDVAEGTLVAYAVRSDDMDIKNPLGRCLLKPFLQDGGDAIKYRRETRIYGNPVPGMAEAINKFLRKLNAGIPEGIYKLNPNLYNDGVGGTDLHRSDSQGSIDWRANDAQNILRENPRLLPSYAEYAIRHSRANDSGPHMPVAMVAYMIDKASVPVRYAKQAADIFARAHRDTIESYVAYIMDTNAAVIDGFLSMMANKAFKKIVNAEADAIYAGMDKIIFADDYNVRTRLFRYGQLSPKAARDEVKQVLSHSIGKNAYMDVAYSCVTGTRDVPRDVVIRDPELHKFVYLCAELLRESAMFGASAHLNRAEAVLASFPAVSTELTEAEFEAFNEHQSINRDKGSEFIGLCYALRCAEAGDFERA